MNMQKEAPETCQEKIFKEFKELEEQRAEQALAFVQKKHMLTKCESERERASIMQRSDVSSAIVPWSKGHDNSPFIVGARGG